ncbi:MAG TPA: hypothetical protein VMU39_08110 [Solirubrobacteraceae bacterium]|nr:hypothetical protein [Solirubrobacteraceae bacterium]
MSLDANTARSAGEVALRERLAAAFGADVLEASRLEVLHDDPPALVVAQVGGLRLSLLDGEWLLAAAVHSGAEHLGVVQEDGSVRWIASVPLAPATMN